MAIGYTVKASGDVDVSGTAHTTNSTLGAITFAAGSLIVVAVGGVRNAATLPSGIVASCTGLTFTPQVNAIQTATDNVADVSIFTAPDTSGGSRAINLATGSTKYFGLYYVIYEVTGHNTSTPTGATASGADSTTDGAKTITLSGAPATSSLVIASIFCDTDPGASITNGVGWNEDADHVATAGGDIQAQSRTSSTSTSVDWADIKPGAVIVYSNAGVAVEIVAAAGGTNATVTFPQSVTLHP